MDNAKANQKSHRIYVATSWRNEITQPALVTMLRSRGHEVYDFRKPNGKDSGFSWRSVDPNWRNWNEAEYREGLKSPAAQAGLRSDFEGMQWADTLVALAPFGRSAALELGWGIGCRKHSAVLIPDGVMQEPELMFGLANRICLSTEELLEWLSEI